MPLNTATTYDETKPFAHAVAQLLERETPDEVVSKQKKELRKGKVLVDWSQNDGTKTTVAVYSLRARERPWVSTPLDWDEVEAVLRRRKHELAVESMRFESADVVRRVSKHGDLFAPVLELKQKLPALDAASSGREAAAAAGLTSIEKAPFEGRANGASLPRSSSFGMWPAREAPGAGMELERVAAVVGR